MTSEQNPQPGSDTGADPAPEQPQHPTAGYSYPQAKRLVRRRDDRMLGGVCSGVADYVGVDVTVVRLLTVLGAIFGLGSLVLVYLVLWIVLPEA